MDRTAVTSDADVLAALRARDEATFVAFAMAHHPTLLRLARAWVKNEAVAEEVVQESWLVMLEGVASFEGRSALKTWLCGIVVNVARGRMRKEARSVPMSSLASDDAPAVDPSRFSGSENPWEGHWSQPPVPFPDSPEAGVLNAELRGVLQEAIAELPEAQREVVVLLDVEGFSSEEAQAILGVTGTHCRVLLHRARAKLRALLEKHYEGRRS